MRSLAELESTQPHAVAVLRAALGGGRRHHAYVLAGPEHEVARDVARAVAAALVCEAPSDAGGCGACGGCRKLAAGNHPDVSTIVPSERGLIGIEAVRDVIGRLGLHASLAKTKVVLIERADTMNPQAQNALLKTLEEPPGATCFLLTAAREKALLPTIRSRTQTLRLAAADRLHAYRALVAAGLEEGVARALGPLVGTDLEAAQAQAPLAKEVLEGIEAFLAAGADPARVARIAADLGGDKEHADLALALLEVSVRDALAHEHGAAGEALYAGAALATCSRAALTRTAARLQELRRLGAYNLNRTLALETVLLTLAGHLGSAPAGRAFTP